MDHIGQELDNPSPTNLASTIVDALSFCIAEAPEHGQLFERSDRLPLFRARREAEAWGKAPTKDFVRHVLESWVLAQHVYWSVGRGWRTHAQAGNHSPFKGRSGGGGLDLGAWSLTKVATGAYSR